MAELLIVLAILGVIATFTIPKILAAQQNSQSRALAKEAAATMAQAFQKAQLEGTITSTSSVQDLTPYINYVSIDSSGTSIDAPPNVSGRTCTVNNICLQLHSGSILWLPNQQFGGTSTLHAINYEFDPIPGQQTSSTVDGPYKSIQFELYFNGQTTTYGSVKPGSSINGNSPYNPVSNRDPSWFMW